MAGAGDVSCPGPRDAADRPRRRNELPKNKYRIQALFAVTVHKIIRLSRHFCIIHNSIFMENTIACSPAGPAFAEEFAGLLPLKKVAKNRNRVQCFRVQLADNSPLPPGEGGHHVGHHVVVVVVVVLVGVRAFCSPRRAPCTHGRGRGRAPCRAPCTHGRGRGEGVLLPPGIPRSPVSASSHLRVSPSPVSPSPISPSVVRLPPSFRHSTEKILVYHDVVQIRLLHRSFFLHSSWKTAVKTEFSGFRGRAKS